MRRAILYLAPLAAAAILAACSSSNSATIERWSIVVGMGGGFSGFTQGYKLLENGEVYRWRAEIIDRQGTKIGTIGADSAKKWHDELMGVDFLKTMQYSPGNVSTFVEYETASSRHAVTWGDPKEKTPERIADWMNKFSAMCTAMDKK